MHGHARLCPGRSAPSSTSAGQRRDYDEPMLALLQDKLYGPQDYGLVTWKAK